MDATGTAFRSPAGTPTLAGRPRDPQRDHAILAATRELLREVGYARLAVEAVARRAGVAKTTIYRRWESKGLLVYDAVFTQTERASLPESGRLEGDLRVAVANVVVEFSAPEAVAALPGLLADFGSDPRLRQLIRERFLPPARAYLAAIFERARERDEVSEQAPVQLVFEALLGAVFLRAVLAEEPLSEELVDQLVALVLEGVSR